MQTIHKSVEVSAKEHMLSIRHCKGGKGVSPPELNVIHCLKLSINLNELFFF